VDIAVNLVESYLRFNGYLTLSEFEVQARNEHGVFESVTDVDIMAIRFPGDVVVGGPGGDIAARMLVIEDPALRLEPGQIDVIVGEVKQGPAEFNPGIRRRGVHSVLQRVLALRRGLARWWTTSPLHCMVGAAAGHPGPHGGLRALRWARPPCRGHGRIIRTCSGSSPDWTTPSAGAAGGHATSSPCW
jgi:hypothetical protein